MIMGENRAAVDVGAAEQHAARNEPAALRLRDVLPHIRAAADRARTEGTVGLGVIAMRDDGGGRVTAQFEADDFFADLALVSDAGEHVPALCAAIREQDAELAQRPATMTIERAKEIT